jgi:ribosomal protein S18 acetylase RimI-like enzyme
MNIHIRPYQDSDKDAVIALHVEALKATGAYVGSGAWDADLADIRKSYVENGGCFLVSTLEGKVIGMGALRKVDDKTAEIKRMRVDPAHQGRGIGKKILSGLEETAQQLGYRRLVLDTAVVLAAAQKLYEKAGYQVFDRGVLGGLDTLYYQKII